MTFVLVWTVYNCVGAVAVLGIRVPLASFPEAAKPAMTVAGLCRAEHRLERYDPAQRPAAQRRFYELPSADLQACRGRECRSMIQRTTVLTVEDPWRGK